MNKTITQKLILTYNTGQPHGEKGSYYYVVQCPHCGTEFQILVRVEKHRGMRCPKKECKALLKQGKAYLTHKTKAKRPTVSAARKQLKRKYGSNFYIRDYSKRDVSEWRCYRHNTIISTAETKETAILRAWDKVFVIEANIDTPKEVNLIV